MFRKPDRKILCVGYWLDLIERPLVSATTIDCKTGREPEMISYAPSLLRTGTENWLL
jgi:hypothetical protein